MFLNFSYHSIHIDIKVFISEILSIYKLKILSSLDHSGDLSSSFSQFVQSIHWHISLHVFNAFLQEHRLVAQPVLHLQFASKASGTQFPSIH